MRRIINVNLGRGPERTYRVIVEDGLIDRAADLIARTWHGKRVFVISDSNVGPLYGGELLRRFLGAGMDAALLNVAAGEASKDARTVQALYTNLLRLGIHRDSLIIALGGGVVGDVAGFVAATIVRGVPYVQMPTSLLAQVDSSVGGKVGINHKLGKNLIGAFHQPAAVFIDPQVLRTLPQAEFRNGLAEVVKIAAALDAPFFRLLERKVLALAKRDPKLLPSVIARSVALKARIVERDEKETGLRKALNLGHTIGHAVEAALQYRIRHGEAVAIGMAAECSIAVEMGLLHSKTRDRVVRLLEQCGLPVRMPRIERRSRFLSALALDKKAEAGSPRFTLLREPGKVVVGVDVPTAFVNQLLDQRN
ncbi:MAG TPA: 3-dehydroquinate synthase [Bacteroidota bacterium]|nr:3-dehydroquinate synthase [Bacteroidota bacterium]